MLVTETNERVDIYGIGGKVCLNIFAPDGVVEMSIKQARTLALCLLEEAERTEAYERDV
jgi:hypothetical protein